MAYIVAIHVYVVILVGRWSVGVVIRRIRRSLYIVLVLRHPYVILEETRLVYPEADILYHRGPVALVLLLLVLGISLLVLSAQWSI